MADTCFASVSASQVGRILAGLDLKPHRVRGWLIRRDTPDFWQRAAAVCALYLDPPEGAVILSIDEKTAIAARSRRHPGRPACPGEPARQEFEYRRHGTASLVAALDVRTGEVLTEVIRRNDALTFTAFLDQLDRAIAPGKEIHVVLDNGSSHTARHTSTWLAAHPRWHVRRTPPHASWHNQVELFFSALTRRVLRHGDFAGRGDLIDKLEEYVSRHPHRSRESCRASCSVRSSIIVPPARRGRRSAVGGCGTGAADVEQSCGPWRMQGARALDRRPAPRRFRRVSGHRRPPRARRRRRTARFVVDGGGSRSAPTVSARPSGRDAL